MNEPGALLERFGGVARTRTLGELGLTKHAQATLVASGALRRPGRGWLALPDADPELLAAARAGVVVTCVSQARRLGLWVQEHPEFHVGAPPHGQVRTQAHVHWALPPVPRAPDALTDPIENVLALVATCRPYEQALAIWESALRQGLVDKTALGRLALSPTARRLLADATPWSDSGLESFIPHRLRWMRIPIVPQVWIAGHRVDFLIGDRLVLQIDGGHHVGHQRTDDVAHDAALALLGYHVVRVTYVQVTERWHTVQDQIMRAVAQGLHRA